MKYQRSNGSASFRINRRLFVLVVGLSIVSVLPQFADAQTDCVNIGTACQPTACTEENQTDPDDTCPITSCCMLFDEEDGIGFTYCQAVQDCDPDCNTGCCDNPNCCRMDTCCEGSTCSNCTPGLFCDTEDDLCCPCAGPSVFPPTGTPLAPITDLTASAYTTANGSRPRGLYVNSLSSPTFQVNHIDDTGSTALTAHFNAGLDRTDQIIPLNSNGLPDDNNGRSS